MFKPLFLLSWIWLCAAPCSAALVYVDASSSNTFHNSDTDSNGTPAWSGPNSSSDNLWSFRNDGGYATLAFGPTVYELFPAETQLLIRTTITGLVPNTTYTDLRLYLIGHGTNAAANNYSIEAAVTSGITVPSSFTLFMDETGTRNSLVNSISDGFGTAGTEPASANFRYWVSMPDVTTDVNGVFSMWVQRPDTGATGRASYDGLAYDTTPVPEPSSYAFLGLVASIVGVVARRRYRRVYC